MQKRLVVAVVIAALTIVSLAGCQATTPGSFTRSDARANVATWTGDAESVLGSPKATIGFDGYEACRTDHAYFPTTSEWRTATSLSMPRARQSAAISTVLASFTGHGWTGSKTAGAVTLVGPKGARHQGRIRVEPDGPASLVITVISPCYT
jgi:hypothetical protein